MILYNSSSTESFEYLDFMHAIVTAAIIRKVDYGTMIPWHWEEGTLPYLLSLRITKPLRPEGKMRRDNNSNTYTNSITFCFGSKQLGRSTQPFGCDRGTEQV